MVKSSKLKEFASELAATIYGTLEKSKGMLPEGEDAREEFLKTTEAFVSATVEKCDLVSREEFDAMKAVLVRLQEKQTKLESALSKVSKKS